MSNMAEAYFALGMGKTIKIDNLYYKIIDNKLNYKHLPNDGWTLSNRPELIDNNWEILENSDVLKPLLDREFLRKK